MRDFRFSDAADLQRQGFKCMQVRLHTFGLCQSFEPVTGITNFIYHFKMAQQVLSDICILGETCSMPLVEVPSNHSSALPRNSNRASAPQ